MSEIHMRRQMENITACGKLRDVSVHSSVFHLALVHRCARMVCSVRSVTAVPGLLAPPHRCARAVRCVACAVFWATWHLFTGLLTPWIVLHLRCPGPGGSSSPVCRLGVLCCVCNVLCHLAPVHRCACLVCCAVCAVSWTSWLLFAGVLSRCVALCV